VDELQKFFRDPVIALSVATKQSLLFPQLMPCIILGLSSFGFLPGTHISAIANQQYLSSPRVAGAAFSCRAENRKQQLFFAFCWLVIDPVTPIEN